MLEVQNLSWTPPGGDEPLWRDFSFALDAGESVVLTGQSGSGKSTLLRCIVHLEKPDSGLVLWRGDQVTPQNIREFRHHVVYVHQSPVPIAPSIEENLSFPRKMSRHFEDSSTPALTEQQQRDLLARFNLPELDFSRRFDELSVGEQQRVALVRCLSVNPDVLLLDEPTASLDDENAAIVEDYIQHYLAHAPDQRAAIWITHDKEQRRRLGDRTIALR